MKHGVDLVEHFTKDLPAISLDEIKMRQVVVNLLVNAVKFSPECAQVTVATVREPRFILLEVRDHGPGIQPDEATHIFELFGQVVSGNKSKSGGLGIGLHVVKRITELHGGFVGLNSIPGEGSSFWVRLPLGSAGEAPPAGDQPALEQRAAA